MHSFARASTFELSEILNLLNASFEGYVVRVSLTQRILLELLRTEGVDLEASLVVAEHGLPVGLSLVGRRGSESRIGPFGLVPSARSRGIGQALLDELLAQSRDRGDERVWLEVITVNDPAIRLYEGRGFVRIRELVGFVSEHVPAVEGLLHEVSAAEVATEVSRSGFENLPWQVSAATIHQLALPDRAFRLGPSLAIVGLPTETDAVIKALVTEREEQRRGHGRRLLQALSSSYPGRTWRIPPKGPGEFLPEFLAPLGFTRSAISQYQMVWRP